MHLSSGHEGHQGCANKLLIGSGPSKWNGSVEPFVEKVANRLERGWRQPNGVGAARLQFEADLVPAQ
jgi:hypothetical protein